MTPTTGKPRQMHSTSVASGQPMHLAHAAKRPGSSAPAAWKTDRIKAARLGELGWTLVPVVVDDVRRHPADLVARISSRLGGGRLAG